VGKKSIWEAPIDKSPVEDIPRTPLDEEDANEKEDLENPDERRPRTPLTLRVLFRCRTKKRNAWHSTERLWDKRVQRDDEMSDSDDEGEGGRKFRASHAGGDVEMVIGADTDGDRMVGASNTGENGVREIEGRPAMPAIAGVSTGTSTGLDRVVTGANTIVAEQAVHTGAPTSQGGGVPVVVGPLGASRAGDLQSMPASGFGTGTVDKDGDAVMD
jgi:histone deacetylase 1/2